MYTKEEMKDYVGPKIGNLCERHKMSIYRLSQLTGITQTAITDMIRKNTMPTVLTLEKICDAFGMSLAQFFSDEDSIPDLTKEQKELVKAWQDMDSTERDILMKVVRSLQQ